ncbi:MAG: beta-hydroxyacyl-ACP dehydratase [Deltaproteobacteria bacterium]|jgi:3-hydroxyacyl-[acyl-carrier-protein] dehydratase|nr:beta-hydroxyacyl-ACP dehydratase [Deltaproteobacteria bacterium]
MTDLRLPLHAAALVALLPHRPPFLLIDLVDALEPGLSASGRWTPPADLPGLSGHFPGDPVVPGVLQLEALAQLSAVVALSLPRAPEAPPPQVRLAGVDDARFRAVVRPGDLLLLQATCAERRRGLWRFTVAATFADGARVCAATLTAGG